MLSQILAAIRKPKCPVPDCWVGARNLFGKFLRGLNRFLGTRAHYKLEPLLSPSRGATGPSPSCQLVVQIQQSE